MGRMRPTSGPGTVGIGGAGSWPGAPDQTTVFPNTMDIDNVRVYQ